MISYIETLLQNIPYICKFVDSLINKENDSSKPLNKDDDQSSDDEDGDDAEQEIEGSADQPID